MKVVVLKSFLDCKNGIVAREGETIDVDKKRTDELIRLGLAEKKTK